MGKFIPAIASQSLGNATNHSLVEKLSLFASHGFKSIELYYEDLECTARSLPAAYPPSTAGTTFASSTTWQEQLYAAATYVHDLCQQLNLDILCLQPFLHYGGLIDRQAHAKRISDLRFWILLARRLDTDLIQVPSSFLPESSCSKDINLIAKDMREIANIGLKQTPPIRFCYEALCWGTQIDHWEQAWKVVKMVDRPNFGTCLDTFNLCGRVYADPAASSGINSTAEQDMRNSIKMLREQLDPKKIFYVEVVDGERLDQPLDQNHPFYVPGQLPRMSWSRNARLFPFEERGYLPVIETLQAILDVGYTGYISFEFFSRTANDPNPKVPAEHARRAQESWNKLVQKMGWDKEARSAQVEVKSEWSPQPQVDGQSSTATPRFDNTVNRTQTHTPLLQAH